MFQPKPGEGENFKSHIVIQIGTVSASHLRVHEQGVAMLSSVLPRNHAPPKV
jgi:hypothetical protein